MAQKPDDKPKAQKEGKGGTYHSVVSGRHMTSPKSERVIKKSSATHRDALKRLVDR